MQQRVFVLDSCKQPLMPCTPARARILLKRGRAAVFRIMPFTIILKDRVGGETQDIELKLDPGSRTTGVALVADTKGGKRVIWAAEISHRGHQVKHKMDQRRAVRRGRRTRKLRHRKPRFSNRSKPRVWLPPSLLSRVHNVENWARRLMMRAPIRSIAVETVRFDTQKLDIPGIAGVEYQQGALAGYEVREYLLEKFKRTCVYCGATNVPLEIEHVIPKSRGGSNRVSNLAISCRACNSKKGTRTAAEFGHPKVEAQCKRPLRDAAAVNATRYAIGNKLKNLGLPVSFWSGGRTKMNRSKQGYAKKHWTDAACVGVSGEHVQLDYTMSYLSIQATGRGNRQACRVDKYGFPRTKPKAVKRIQGLQTGDRVSLTQPRGKYAGHHVGTLASIAATGQLTIKTTVNKISAPARRYTLLQKMDGYRYTIVPGTTIRQQRAVRLTP